MEGHTPTVTHRSVRGHRAPPPAGRVGGGGQQHAPLLFAFDHQEVYPAPADSSSWRLGASASRVFEVWGGPAEGPPEGNGGSPGRAEALLGLAKVSLGPFAAFGSAGWRGGEEEAAAAAAAGGGGGGGGVVEGSRLAVGADGPVVIVDPFSGRTVGELHLLLALGASSTIAALSGPRAGDGTAAAVVAAEGGVGKEEHTAADGGVGAGGAVNEREQEAEGRLDWETERKETADGEDGAGALSTDQEPAALDDSVAGETLHWKTIVEIAGAVLHGYYFSYGGVATCTQPPPFHRRTLDTPDS